MLSEREGLQLPADLYLEGSDQHRGQLSLQADLAGMHSLAQSGTGRATSNMGPHSSPKSGVRAASDRHCAELLLLKTWCLTLACSWMLASWQQPEDPTWCPA